MHLKSTRKPTSSTRHSLAIHLLMWLGLSMVVSSILLDTFSLFESREDVLQIVDRNLQRELHLLELESNGFAEDSEDFWDNLSHPFFLVEKSKIVRWNDNVVRPDQLAMQEEFSLKLWRSARGIRLVKKWPLGDGRFLLGVVSLYDQFKINNRYLVSGWNRKIFPTSNIQVLDPLAPEGNPFLWNGRTVFKVDLSGNETISYGGNLGTLLFWMGLVIFLISFFLWQRNLYANQKIALILFLLVTVFLGGRLILLYFDAAPTGSLFDPTYFASSSVNRSVGDLFINTLCVFVPIIFLFFNYHKLRFVARLSSRSEAFKFGAGVVLLLVSFFSLLFPFLFFETIIHNSSIALDITQSLKFDLVRSISFFSIIIGSIAAFMLCHVAYRISAACTGHNTKRFILQMAIAGLLFWLYTLIDGRNYSVTLLVSLAYLLALHFSNVTKSLFRISYVTFLYFFLAITILAIQGAFAIKQFTEEDRIDSQYRFANTFLIDRDILGEYLLDESARRISDDPFIQTRMGSPFLSKSVVRQKVKLIHLNSYFDRYDVRVHLFGPSGNSFDNSIKLNFAELVQQFAKEANATNYDGIFFIRNPTLESTKQYLVIVPISRFGANIGYVVLDLSLKRVIPGNVFPELLLDNRFAQYFLNRNFSYAIYSDSEIVNSFGDFNYEKNLQVEMFRANLEEELEESGFVHIFSEDELGRTIVVSSPAYKYFNVVSNFSFHFTLGLFVIFLLLLSYGIGTLIQGKELNYSAKIQLYIYLAFILPLVLVSLSTMSLIGRAEEEQLKEDYRNKSKILGDQLAPILESYKVDSLSLGEVDNRLVELSKMANVDASIYATDGTLVSTSQPLVFEDKILSGLVRWEALQTIVEDKEVSFVGSERVGSLDYNNAYFALKSPTSGQLLGILSLPFFESAFSLEKTQINVLSNILIIFCIIFILFSLVSFFAVRWLTFPLEFITKTLRATTLTGSNRALTWNSNDEIGMMVAEYNKMLENLESSKVELSRVQKEAAWREIAKQVAHEVKNPLTPMKLTLQQMEQSLQSGGLETEKTKKSVKTLLSQVEILNDIAASFSAFARMPAPILEKIELTALLKKVVDLHLGNSNGTIALRIPDKKIFIMADQQLLSRVFSNLILNGLQSSDDDTPVHMEVAVSIHEDQCTITFSDNGQGIEEELRDKIFLPHFSTKKTGSGIGLAIAKQGIEHNGGTIRFETKKGVGTAFYVVIPVA